MKLFVTGRQFKPKHEPPFILRIKVLLDKSKPGELFPTHKLASALGCYTETLRSNNDFLEGYFHVYKGKKYFGSVATIKQLRKETENAKR